MKHMYENAKPVSTPNNYARIVILMENEEKEKIVNAANQSILNSTSAFCKHVVMDKIRNSTEPDYSRVKDVNIIEVKHKSVDKNFYLSKLEYKLMITIENGSQYYLDETFNNHDEAHRRKAYIISKAKHAKAG